MHLFHVEISKRFCGEGTPLHAPHPSQRLRHLEKKNTDFSASLLLLITLQCFFCFVLVFTVFHVQNALKLKRVHVLCQKIFRGLYPGPPFTRGGEGGEGRGRGGKKRGGARKGRKGKGEGKEGKGRGREGEGRSRERVRVEGIWPPF
jgi:hypothetical protein